LDAEGDRGCETCMYVCVVVNRESRGSWAAVMAAVAAWTWLANMAVCVQMCWCSDR
jgi:hypothetical protein